MAVILYHNGFDGEMSKNATDHSLVGDTVIEVWTELQVFETHRARVNYFNNSPAHHVLTVVHEEFDGVKKWYFTFDDKDQETYAPLDVLPSDEVLEEMVLTLAGV